MKLSFPCTLFSVVSLVPLTVRNCNKPIVRDWILMRKSVEETGNGTLGACSHDMGSLETMGCVHSFSKIFS